MAAPYFTAAFKVRSNTSLPAKGRAPSCTAIKPPLPVKSSAFLTLSVRSAPPATTAVSSSGKKSRYLASISFISSISAAPAAIMVLSAIPVSFIMRRHCTKSGSPPSMANTLFFPRPSLFPAPAAGTITVSLSIQITC